MCGVASDLDGSDNVVFCRGYGDVPQKGVGNCPCCSYLWVGLPLGEIEVLGARVCTGLICVCVVDRVDCCF